MVTTGRIYRCWCCPRISVIGRRCHHHLCIQARPTRKRILAILVSEEGGETAAGILPVCVFRKSKFLDGDIQHGSGNVQGGGQRIRHLRNWRGTAASWRAGGRGRCARGEQDGCASVCIRVVERNRDQSVGTHLHIGKPGAYVGSAHQ